MLKYKNKPKLKLQIKFLIIIGSIGCFFTTAQLQQNLWYLFYTSPLILFIIWQIFVPFFWHFHFQKIQKKKESKNIVSITKYRLAVKHIFPNDLQIGQT